ncbi:NifB/NifX family molybdenum-iron cluster-binding protein [Methanococcus maripaludis]|uniref:Dinitrogenase iron-molybdenum cofactor biosynthesis protein n=2 Tax=Methanococcus maripaludis TaxID=39152 RepID=A6VJ80_METM7|nr:NifB/NifX family molybdenum-iron cluster-binding protein [Methanococcus maripaludis]MBA2862220.1 putative Fe-Mo cluster-binding NifX family protein [Methanococcus maripaludis]
MKIAIPALDEKTVSSHFGKTPFFMIFEINENKEIIGSKKVGNSPCHGAAHEEGHGGQGPGTTVQTLLSEGVNAVVFVNMGQRSVNALASVVELYQTSLEDVEAVLKEFLNGNLAKLN